MGWRALRFVVDSAHAERWAEALLGRGASSVDIADADAGTPEERPVYGEPDRDDAEGSPRLDWPRNQLCALLPEALDPAEVLAAAAQSIGEDVPSPYEASWLDDRDWVRATQAQFGPQRVADGLWVVPTWVDPPEPRALNIRLDPGVAFGTGTHATTRLCLEWLAQHPPRGCRVLDYGCGSGILAIAAARLGAREVAGVDIDPQALRAARANAAANEVEGLFLLPGELRAGRFDVVLANILARPLFELAPLLAGRCREGGSLVLAGLLDEQVEGLVAAYRPWFMIEAWRSREGWSVLAGVRRAG